MLRRIPTALVLVLVLAAPSASARWRPGPGGWTSGPVEWLRTMPLETAAMGGRLHGNLLIVTTLRSFALYDVSQPLDPVLLSTTPLAAQTYNEQPQTNGQILLLTRNGTLDIFDIRDPRAPTRIAAFADGGVNHIWTCVLACSYAYGGKGTILDLANPAEPREVGDWTEGLSILGFHTVREVAPGIVMTGSAPSFVLDGRVDPAKPTVVARAQVEQTMPNRPLIVIGTPRSLPADVHWPQAAERYAMLSTETVESGECNERSGSFYTYDTEGWETRGTFLRADEYQITDNGIYIDGAPPAHALGCSAYAFDPRPGAREVAVAWFEHGTRFLRIDDEGTIEEFGGFLGPGSVTVQPLWRTEEIVYVLDAARGLEILHVEPTVPGAQITDPSGDANGTGADGMRPASLDGADLVTVRYETTWVDVPIGEDGIHREPNGLRVLLRTRGTQNADGPTIAFGLEATAGTCDGAFTAAVRGPLAGPSDPPHLQAAWQRYSSACPGGAGRSTSAAWSAVVAGRDLVLTLPFSGLNAAEAALLRPGTVLHAPLARTATSARGIVVVGEIQPGTVDRTAAAADWTIGSDVPPDVPCTRGCP